MSDGSDRGETGERVDATLPNLVLLGFMGTGKTTIGKRLANWLNCRFYDMDEEIERRMGMSISEIFARYGEPFFRDLEATVARELAATSGKVIATGGGVVINPENLAALRRRGWLISLVADPEIIYERVIQENNRPLLEGDNLMDKIRKLLAARDKQYRSADLVVDISNLSTEQIVGRITEWLMVTQSALAPRHENWWHLQ
ncbi:MAG: shikimate kinase [Actinobacteria bacterium]|nr:shikimate kinase [Actinomycetota bacterium]